MKKTFLLLSVVLLTMASCSVKNEKIENLPAKEQWSQTHDGGNYTVPQYPDLYSHYWEYAWSVKDNPAMALKVHGAYPHSRYFSFTLYNDADGSAINGSSDYQLLPDEGSVNPFVETSDKDNYFTVYIVPAKVATEEALAQLDAKNLIVVNEEVENANIIIRQYLSQIDEYGGVDMPAIDAIDLTTMKEVKTPICQESNVFRNIPPFSPRKSDALDDVPFMLAPHGSFYPNNATDYLYARTALEDDQVLYFSFLPVPMPQKVEDYQSAHARYWSICVGSCMDTRSYYSINYEQAQVPDGEKVAFVICTKQNPRLAEIEQRVKDQNAKGINTQIIVYDREQLSYNGKTQNNGETVGNVLNVLYRNILPDASWENSISKIVPTAYLDPETKKTFYEIAYDDPEHKIASRVVGEYGPHGKKVSNAEFLK